MSYWNIDIIFNSNKGKYVFIKYFLFAKNSPRQFVYIWSNSYT